MESIFMTKLSDNKLIHIFIQLLFLVVLAKLISVILLWFLPLNSVDKSKVEIQRTPYTSFDFHVMIEGSKSKKIPNKQNLHKPTADITNMLLVGLYGNEHYGYAIVAMKKTPNKTEIISIGQSYQGYKLIKIGLNYVVFNKDNKEYILRLKSAIKNAKHLYTVVSQDTASSESIHTISQEQMNFYIKNPDRLWKDIAINEVKNNGKITGFKVTRIKNNSPLSTLGLQKGDIIIEANGTVLNSYSKVLKIYQNINQIERLILLVKRGDQEKEIIYEIR